MFLGFWKAAKTEQHRQSSERYRERERGDKRGWEREILDRERENKKGWEREIEKGVGDGFYSVFMSTEILVYLVIMIASTKQHKSSV